MSDAPDSSAAERLTRFAGARCVVTGGMGFIGSNLALALARAGASVCVIDAMVPSHGANPHNLEGAARPIEVVVAEIGRTAEVEAALRGAQYVFNLAGQISHLDSMEDPLADFDWNARSHLAFLELLRATSSRAVVVYTSTRQIYGRPLYVPVDEDHPVRPVDVNGISQHAAEQLHLLYAQVYGLRACSLRLTNVYGPRLRLTESRQGVIGVFLRRALQGEPIAVYGDGSQLREFLYVDDAVQALLAAALSPEAVGEAFNVSHGERITLRRAAQIIVEAASAASGAGWESDSGSGSDSGSRPGSGPRSGSSASSGAGPRSDTDSESVTGPGSAASVVTLVPWPRERAAIDIGDFVGDSSKARRVLGWTPRVSFADGIRATIDFFREHRRWYL